MQTSDFNHLQLLDAWYEQDPVMHIRVTFPFYAATGNEHSGLSAVARRT